jgi:hypothetical protein
MHGIRRRRCRRGIKTPAAGCHAYVEVPCICWYICIRYTVKVTICACFLENIRDNEKFILPLLKCGRPYITIYVQQFLRVVMYIWPMSMYICVIYVAHLVYIFGPLKYIKLWRPIHLTYIQVQQFAHHPHPLICCRRRFLHSIHPSIHPWGHISISRFRSWRLAHSPSLSEGVISEWVTVSLSASTTWHFASSQISSEIR